MSGGIHVWVLQYPKNARFTWRLELTLKITVKFSCPEVLGGLQNGVYDVAEGISIRELLSACEKECNFQVNENHLKWLLVIADGRQVNWHNNLSGDCNVLFLRGALGG